MGATPSTWNFGSTGPPWSEIADFELIIARSASAVTRSEKSSINTNRKSNTRFPVSLRWSSYVAANTPKGGTKKQIGRFSSNIALLLKKVCYKVSLCENCQRQSCRSFIGLTIRAKIVGGWRPILPEILSQSDRVNTNRKSTKRFPRSIRQSSYVAPKFPKKGAQKRKTAAYGLSIDTNLNDLNGLERRNCPHIAFSHRIRLLCWPVMS